MGCPWLATWTFKGLLWLVALDPDPYPRCVEVRKSDLARFPSEEVCDGEARFWNVRAGEVLRHLDHGVSPWGYELRREYEQAEWLWRAWKQLAEAHWSARCSWAGDQVIHHLGRYKGMVGDGAYVTGWSPPRMRP